MERNMLLASILPITLFLLMTSSVAQAEYQVSSQLNKLCQIEEITPLSAQQVIQDHLWYKTSSKKRRTRSTLKLRPDYWLKIGPKNAIKKQFKIESELFTKQLHPAFESKPRKTKCNLTNMVIKTNIKHFNVDAKASLDVNDAAKFGMFAKAGISYAKEKYSVNAYQTNSFSISNKKSVSKTTVGFGYELTQNISTNISLIQEFKPTTGSYLKSTNFPGARIALINMAVKI